jgi:hypothetical protein
MPFDDKVTAKEGVRKMLDLLPDDATYEDIQYHIYVREKIERGLQEMAEGKGVSEEEMEKIFNQWLSE